MQKDLSHANTYRAGLKRGDAEIAEKDCKPNSATSAPPRFLFYNYCHLPTHKKMRSAQRESVKRRRPPQI